MPTHDDGVPDGKAPDSNGSKGDVQTEMQESEPELPRWATKSNAATPFSDARMSAYIGPRWESSYRQKLTPFFEDPAFAVSWNWAAFLVGPLWFLYRKLYLAFALFFIVFQVLQARMFVGFDKAQLTPNSIWGPEGSAARPLVLGLLVSIHLASAGTANWLLFRRARAASLVVTMQQVPEDVALTRLQRLGGVTLLPVVLLLLMQFAIAIAATMAPAN